jgi:nitroimidazol reductase NimA-like FMN-containing flavoprotein (pyridoxamine 5'-phosphate oxidase superfamily)
MIGSLTAEASKAVLQSNTFGRIGCSDGSKIYVVPINYVFDGRYIIAHSVAGMKINMMRQHPKICFEVDEVISQQSWKSVIAWGQYQELTNGRDRYEAMKLLADRKLYMKISETAIPPETSERRVHPRSPGIIKPVIYRIVIEEMTGRYEKN